MSRPLCFVLMPFGRKSDGTGAMVDFDAVYRELIKPAIEAAELQPIRADEEQTGGIIHTAMFEQLILCDYAVADLTTANANVFYELGVRHAMRPWTTVLLFAEGGRLPFDVAPLRAMPYRLTAGGTPADAAGATSVLATRLRAAGAPAGGSPVFELLKDLKPPEIAHLKTDLFRERVHYSTSMKERLAGARQQGVEAVRVVQTEMGPIGDAEAGVVIDLFLSYRAVKAWPDMIALVSKMSLPLAESVLVQEQLGLALNRDGRGDDAERVLTELIRTRGPSSETYGILGRVYKDRWEAALKAGDKFLAKGLLDKAIDAYLKGFEADWRDAYPGVNAVTLMEFKEPPDPRRVTLIPVVAYAVERRIAGGKPDYWDHATLLELAVLAKDESKASDAVGPALAAVREAWEPETTARNLRLIREARERRRESVPWAKEIEDELVKKSPFTAID